MQLCFFLGRSINFGKSFPSLGLTAILATGDTLYFVSAVLWASSTIVRVPNFRRELVDLNEGCVSAWNVGGLLCGTPPHQHCSLKAIDLGVFFMMRAVMMLFVFHVSISFGKNAGFLAMSFSMVELAFRSVSMTSTGSASDLLKSFASFGFHGLCWYRRGHACWSHSIGPLLCWTIPCSGHRRQLWFLCASVSVEHVRLDLELTTVVQHCPNLVDLRRAKLISLCWSPSLLQDLLTFAVLGFRLHLVEVGRMISRISNRRHTMLQALAASLTILTTAWLRVSRSSKVFSSLMRLISDRTASCASCNCGISIFFWPLWTGICFCFTLWNCTCGIRSLLSVLCCTSGVHHFCLWTESGTSRLLLLISTWTVGLVSASLRDRQQPCWWTAAGATQLSCASARPSGPVCASSCGTSFITSTISSNTLPAEVITYEIPEECLSVTKNNSSHHFGR